MLHSRNQSNGAIRRGYTRAVQASGSELMRRLYYLANDLHVCELIARALKEEGISDWNFHVVSKDGLGLYQHGIHAATAYQELDVLHTGERWGLAGLAIGLGVGALL